MSTHDELGARQPPPPTGPTGDLLLAQALEACIVAERARPGSSAAIIARAPAASRAELRRLVELARALETSVEGVAPAAEFRAAARIRLMRRISGDRAPPVELTGAHLMPLRGPRRPTRGRPWRWFVRSTAGLLAAVLATTATLTASANALPGDVLYGLKQAQEELNLRLASDDQARVLAHLRRADARLDETARLLQDGRTSDAVVTAQRYDQSVERATTTFFVTIDPSETGQGRAEPLETKLGLQQRRLEAILQSAPEPARPDLREALATTERGRELMADPRPVERALGLRPNRPPAAAPVVPTSHAEEQPTRVPTHRPTSVPAAPTLPPVIANDTEHDTAVALSEGAASSPEQDNEPDTGRAQVAHAGPSSSGPGNNRQATPAHNQGSNRGTSSQAQGDERARPAPAAQPDSASLDAREDRGDAVAVRPPTGAAEPPASGAAQGDDGTRAQGDDGARAQGGTGARANSNTGQANVARPQTVGPAPATDARTSPRTANPEGSANPANSATANNSSSSKPSQGDERASRPSNEGNSGASNAGASPQTRTPTATPTPTARRGSDQKPAEVTKPEDDKKSNGGDDH